MFAVFLLRICLDLQNRVCLLPGYINELRIYFRVCLLPGYYQTPRTLIFRNLDIQHEKIIQIAKGSPVCVLIHHKTAGFSKGWQESNGWGNSWHFFCGPMMCGYWSKSGSRNTVPVKEAWRWLYICGVRKKNPNWNLWPRCTYSCWTVDCLFR